MASAPSAPASPDCSPSDGGVVRVLRDDGSLNPDHDPRLEVVEVMAIYRAMVRARLVDERMATLQRQGRVGFHVSSRGEEAAIVGAAAALRPDDPIFPSYRESGAALWRGLPLDAYVNHMFGNEVDPVKGRQMPDHLSARRARFASVSSPVATQIAHAAGFAWAAKIDGAAARREGRKPLGPEGVVTLVYFGDGALSASELHCGMNFAGVFKVPLVLFCRTLFRDDASSQEGSQTREAPPTTMVARLADCGLAYGIPTVRCDGDDLFAVVAATRAGVARARRGEGPTLLDVLTSRMAIARGGVRDGDGALGSVDPIARVRLYLERRGVWAEVSQRALESEVNREIEAAIERAERLAAPAPGTMFDDVFARPTPPLDEQRALLLASPRATGLARI